MTDEAAPIYVRCEGTDCPTHDAWGGYCDDLDHAFAVVEQMDIGLEPLIQRRPYHPWEDVPDA